MNAQTTQPDRPNSAPASRNPLIYVPRACHCFGTITDLHNTYKVYVILSDLHTLADCPPAATLGRLMLRAFDGWDAPEDHPAGFGILHLARDGTYVLASRWNNANNLRHRAFSIDLARPDSPLAALSDAWIIACVWELQLIKREADAWISAVLQRGQADLTAGMIEDYAAIQFTGAL